jgi:hypothetical protein
MCESKLGLGKKDQFLGAKLLLLDLWAELQGLIFNFEESPILGGGRSGD